MVPRWRAEISRALRNTGIVLVLGVLGLGAYLLLRAQGRQAQTTAAGLSLPAQITPFSVVAFLRRLQHEAGAKLDETARQSLSQQIEEIEATFFRGKPVPASAPDLDAVARKWLQTVS